MDILRIDNLVKTYPGGKRAVDSLSLAVAPGDLYGFIGPNGAGKTTTIRAVVGAMDFDGGEIAVCGHSVKREPLLCKRELAYIPDNPDLYDYLTGIGYVNFIADIYRVPRGEREARTQAYAQLVVLTGALGDPIASYSHGMKQKLSLIAALVHAPKLLVLDEPFVGLDPQAAFHLKGVMKEICQAGGAIFFSTHVLEVAEKLCNRVAIIKAGRLVTSGPIAQVLSGASLEDVFMEVAGEHA